MFIYCVCHKYRICLHSSQASEGEGGTRPYSACSHSTVIDDSTGYDKVGNCYATKVDTMVDIVREVDLNKDKF